MRIEVSGLREQRGQRLEDIFLSMVE